MLGWWWSWCENNYMFSFYHDMLQWAEYWWYKYRPLKSTFPKIYKIVVLAFYLHKLCHYKRQENAKWWWLRFDYETPKQWPYKFCGAKSAKMWSKSRPVQEARAVSATHDSYSETRGIFAVCCAGRGGDCKGFTIEIPSESMIGKLVLSQHPLI